MDRLGIRAISEVFLDPNEEPLKSILRMTWKELCDQGWIEEHLIYGQTRYRLTGSGSVEGLWRIGAGKDKAILGLLGALSAAPPSFTKNQSHEIPLKSCI